MGPSDPVFKWDVRPSSESTRVTIHCYLRKQEGLSCQWETSPGKGVTSVCLNLNTESKVLNLAFKDDCGAFLEGTMVACVGVAVALFKVSFKLHQTVSSVEVEKGKGGVRPNSPPPPPHPLPFPLLCPPSP